LHANVARFERATSPPTRNVHTSQTGAFGHTSQTDKSGVFTLVSALQGRPPLTVPYADVSSTSALVLDDSCAIDLDLSRHVMGRVIDINSIPSLRSLLMDEGFLNIKLMYLGGMWVMLECDNVDTKSKLMKHMGVNSWFLNLKDAIPNFGEIMDLEDNNDSSFGRKCLCIKTKYADSILEKFKIVFKGKVYMVRAKELFTWNPCFLEPNEMVYSSDEESVRVTKKILFTLIAARRNLEKIMTWKEFLSRFSTLIPLRIKTVMV
nr:hypothetical protein [Tanacetum cinerariifolium]